MLSSPMRFVLWLPAFTAAAVAGWWTGRTATDWQSSSAKSSRTASASPSRLGAALPPAGGQWIDRVKTAPSVEFPALFTELKTLFPAKEDFEPAARFLFAEWSGRDADAAVDFAEQQEDGDKLLELALTALAQAWPEKALTILIRREDRFPFPYAAWDAFIEFHPDIYLQRFADPDSKPLFWRDAVKSLASRDPVAAATIWAKGGDLDESKAGHSLAFDIGTRWAKQDYAAARQWANSLPPGDARRMALHACISALAQRDPVAALKQLPGEDLGKPRFMDLENRGFPADDSYAGDARMEIAEYLAVRDFEAAMAAAPALANHISGAVETNSYPADPFEESEGTHKEILTDLRKLMIFAKVESLPADASAIPEVDALLQMITPLNLKGEFNPDLADEIRSKVIERLSAEDCLAAFRQRMDAGAPDDDLLSTSLLGRAGKLLPRDVMALFPRLSSDARSNMAGYLYAVLPEGATELRAALIPDLPATGLTWSGSENGGDMALYAPNVLKQQPDIRKGFVSQWARIDPLPAAQWVAALPHSTVETRALISEWAGYDDAAASAWVSLLSQSETRDAAAAELAGHYRDADPATALNWTLSISDRAERGESLLQLLRHQKDAATEYSEALQKACAAEGISIDDEFGDFDPP